jgi:hypothetical protein
VLKSGKLKFALATMGAVLAASVVAAIPSASADACTVSVTLLSGQIVNFNVSVPAGTPLSSISLPVSGPVKNVSESCQSGDQGGTGTNTTTTSSTSTSTQSSTTPPPTTTTSTSKPSPTTTAAKPAPTKPAKKPGKKKATPPKKATSRSGGAPLPPKPAPKANPPAPSGPGAPTPANPTYSFSLPGPAPLGVPNFFIDSFRIPPFLLPIYQAAGIEYDVPWQVLAAINEIETDYGRNLSVSSAGAVGWMQFMPATWKRYGVDANGDGVADPYNPVDAIFTAARYLSAAGAASNLSQAIFAYNHADWYVQSVLLRAKLIGGMPSSLIGALTGLVQGHFPVAAPATYADASVDALAKQRVKGTNAAVPVMGQPGVQSVSIFAQQNAPVIAVNDGKIVKIGQSTKLGRYVELQDQTGNTYTYAHLGSVTSLYPVPKPVRITAADLARELVTPSAPKPTAPASAGTQSTPSVSTAGTARAGGAGAGAPLTLALSSASPTTLPTTAQAAGTGGAAPPTGRPAAAASSSSSPPALVVKERLFANPQSAASYAAGGDLQVKNLAAQISSFREYFSDVLHLGKNEYTLQPLKPGAIVVAGTILGRIAAGSPTEASHMSFMVQPAGPHAPYIDPKPILDGWKLLEATAVYRAAGVDPFFGPGAKNATIGQVLLMSKEQLTNRVLSDPHVTIYSCGRRDITAGQVDRRILATIEFLSASGLDPTVSGLVCGAQSSSTSGVDPAGATGSSMDISAINGIPVQGHQGAGSITDMTVRRLLTLQGALQPSEIVTLMSYKGQTNTMALPDHSNRIQVEFTPQYGQNKKLTSQMQGALKPSQWIQLINRIGQIPEPSVPTVASKYAIRVGPSH